MLLYFLVRDEYEIIKNSMRLPDCVLRGVNFNFYRFLQTFSFELVNNIICTLSTASNNNF